MRQFVLLIGASFALSGCTGSTRDGRNDPWDYGGLPPQNGDSLTAGTWSAWARREWPAACAKLQIRYAVGRVSRQGRICELQEVKGIVPVSEMRAKGELVMPDQTVHRVAWNWTDPTNFTEKTACAADPIDDNEHAYVLVRSNDDQGWHLSPARMGAASRVQDDGIKETCDDLDRFLGTVSAKHGMPDEGAREGGPGALGKDVSG